MRKSVIGSFAIMAALAAAPAIAEGMNGMGMGAPAAHAQVTHVTRGTVKKVDAAGGKVTLAHEPVESLNWPAMTMGFKVQDRALLDSLTEGRQVEVAFIRDGKDYVITSVK